MQRGFRWAALAAASASIFFSRAAFAGNCESDTQCPGDQVCQNGTCTDPGAKPPARARPAAPAEESHPPPPSRAPPAASSEEAPPPKRAPAPVADPAGGSGAACMRDTECPGDEECVQKICTAPSRSRRSGGGGQRSEAPPPPQQRAPSSFSEPPPAVQQRPRVAQGRAASSGFVGTGFTAFANLGAFLENAAQFGSRPGISGEAHLAYAIGNNLSLVGIGELGIVLQESGILLPLTIAGGARFEHLGPVNLVGGLGLTLAPYPGAPIAAPHSFFSGFTVLAEAIYPLPGTQFALKGQLSWHALSDFTLIALTAGGGMAF